LMRSRSAGCSYSRAMLTVGGGGGGGGGFGANSEHPESATTQTDGPTRSNRERADGITGIDGESVAGAPV